MGAVVGALGECGYGIAWRVLDAQYFGVPQKRRRIFIVGHRGKAWTQSAEVLFESQSSVGDSPQGRETEEGAPTDTGNCFVKSGRWLTQSRVSTLQGGGKRGYRIDAEAAAGGHLIVSQSE